MAEKMSFVAFSGTADKLQALATMVSGAAAMGVETHVFLTFWGLNAFRKELISTPMPISPEYGTAGEQVRDLMVKKGVQPWYEVLGMAKDIGDVKIHACAMTMDLMDLQQSDLDPMVDDVLGVGTFIGIAEGGSILFI
ncbi:MAG: DsrE/DsrF/DrsH-like family protein [Actinobacteria bacterium]|jgi:peroxiredoxin family protein|nr:DsrE/DsrF/DrsH-like family protein [Actinomycetota bacterium]MCL6095906.1 DsrE/DsrF/DrsH-like family protein [Actinomycetota bacterium]